MSKLSHVQNVETAVKTAKLFQKVSKTGNVTLMLLAVTFIFSSCGSLFKVSDYSVGLSKVETPANAKIQYGDTKIVNVEEEGKSKYRYEDDFIEITWFVGLKQFYFDLKNKSNYSIKIPWDDVSYVNEKGAVMRLMHNGVKYIDRNASQPASVIPKNASISDILLPTDNVYYTSGQYGGWSEKYLFPQYRTQEAAQKSEVIGKSVRIVFPIIIESVTNEYVFNFDIKGVTVK